MNARCKLFALLTLLSPLAIGARAEVVVFQEGLSPSAAYQTQVAYGRSADNAGSSTNPGDGSSLFVGQISNGQVTFGYLGFDLSYIPAGSTINSASLTLTAQAANGDTVDEIHMLSLHEMIGTFDETTVSYDNRDNTGPTTWATPGGDYNAAVLASTSANPSTVAEGDLSVFSSASIDSLIQSAVNGSGAAWFVVDSADSRADNDRGLFRFHSDSSDDVTLRPKLEVDFLNSEGGLDVTIDRTTGEIILQNNESGTLENIIGYSLTSAVGALDRTAWTPIAGNYDGTSPDGDSSVDSEEWTILEGQGGPYDLSESVFSGDGGSVAVSQTVNLGPAWIKNGTEDVVLRLLVDDGSIEGKITELTPTFVPGAGGFASFEFGDLEFDGDIDAQDFQNVFVPNYLADTSAMSPAQAYQAGDLNADGITDIFDFIIFNGLYKEAQPGAAVLTFSGSVGVPEPSTLALWAIGAVGLFIGHRRPRLAACAAMLLGFFVSVPASAVTVRNLTTGELLFFDDFESAPQVSSLEFQSTGNDSIDADPVVPLGSPVGSSWFTPFRRIDNVTDLEVIDMTQVIDSTSGNDPGAFHGNNYLRNQRTDTSGQTISHPVFATQSTPGDVIRMSAMIYVVDGLDSGSGPGITAWGFDDQDDISIIISNQVRSSGQVRNSDGTSGTTETSIVTVEGVDFEVVEGEWNHVAIDYTVGSQVYDYTLNGVTASGLGIRSNTPLAIESINAFGFGASTWEAGQDQGIYVDSAPELTLRVNEETGDVALVNGLGSPLDIDSYRITSATPNAFVDSAFSGLEGAGYDGGAWTKLPATTQHMAEAALGDSSIGDGDSISLGAVYNTTTAATDLLLEYHVVGSLENMLISSLDIEFVSGGLTGDFNADGVVNIADYTVWRDNLGGSDAALNGNADNTDGLGIVNAADYAAWKSNFGASSGSGSLSALSTNVPEPNSVLMLLGAFFTLGAVRMKPSALTLTLLAVSIIGVARNANASINVTAEYLFGDNGESASVGNPITETWEQKNTSGENDLVTVEGDPVYENVANLNGGYAGSGVLSADFDGTGEALLRDSAEDMPDLYYPPLASTGGTGMELWVFPRSNNVRQGIVYNEKNEVGVAITSSGQWTQIAAGHFNDSDILGTESVVTGEWTHLMQHVFPIGTPGAPTLVPGSGDPLDFISVLYVNGRAVSAHLDDHDVDENSDLTVGHDGDGSPDYFDGSVDTLRFYNSTDFNLLTDNPMVVAEILSISTTNGSPITGGAIKPGDLNLDDVVDSADEALFVSNWLYQNRMDGFHGDLLVGDLTTWQKGDFNLDGRVELADVMILHNALEPLGGFNFALLNGSGANVPEPPTIALLCVATALAIATRRRQP